MSSEWIGGIVSAPEALSEEGAERLVVAVWIDAADAVLGMEMGLRAESAQLLASALREALDESDEGPEAVRIADEAWADAVREVAGDEIGIRIGETPELEGIDQQLEVVLAGAQEAAREPSFTEGGAIAPERIGRLFEAAKRLVAGDAWIQLSEEAPASVDVSELGVNGACLVFSDTGPGFLLFESFQDYLAAEEAEDEGIEARIPVLHLGFERKGDLAQPMREEMDTHGWTPGLHGAVPVLVAIGSRGLPRPLEERDVLLASSCAEAVAELLAAGIPEDEEEIRRSVVPAGLPAVELTLPHAEYQSPEEQLLEAFVEEEEGRGDVDPMIAEEVVVAALEFKGASDADASIWSPAEVEEFLLLYVPRNVALQESELLQVPAVFGRLLRLIGSRYGAMDEKRLRRLLDHVDEVASRYRLAIADPSRWSTEKATMLRALELGIDPDDVDALARIASEVSAAPSIRAETKVGRNDPCPCGSGKKFKKCCG